jgi:alanine racemase
MAWTVGEIANILGVDSFSSTDDAEIRHLQIDSRVNFPPSKTVFFAIRGEQHDGHNYVSDLIDRGYRFFVVERIEPNWKGQFVLVENTVQALQKIASEKRNRSAAEVIGITGSNGKTIVKEWLNQLLTPSFNTVASPRSYNSQVGVPISVWELKKQTQKGVFEAGISQPGEMQRLQSIIRPDLGVFTTLGAAHDENFADRAEKLKEKVQLFKTSKRVICQSSDVDFQREVKELNPNVEIITWSVQSDVNADFVYHFTTAENGSMVSFELNE